MNTKKLFGSAIFLLLLLGCQNRNMAPSSTSVIETAVSPVSISPSISTALPPTTSIPILTMEPEYTATTFITSTPAPHPTRTHVTPVPTTRNRVSGNNRFGISFDMEDVPSDYSHIIESASEIGMDWVRFRFDSRGIEPQMNQFDWAFFDTVVAKVIEEDMQILGVLGYTSLWNATIVPGSGEGANPYIGQYYPPFDYEIWGNSVYQIVSHYKDDVHYWEVWNEPDTGIGSPDAGNWQGSPQEYAQLLATAYTAIKSADPTAKVILGSLSNPQHSGTKANSNPTFLDEILADKVYPAANYFDIIGIHFYDAPENLRTRINEIATTLATTNTSERPIWITEISYPTDVWQREGSRATREQYFCRIISTDMVASNFSIEKFFLFDRYELFITPGNCHVRE